MRNILPKHLDQVTRVSVSALYLYLPVLVWWTGNILLLLLWSCCLQMVSDRNSVESHPPVCHHLQDLADRIRKALGLGCYRHPMELWLQISVWLFTVAVFRKSRVGRRDGKISWPPLWSNTAGLEHVAGNGFKYFMTTLTHGQSNPNLPHDNI